MQLGRAASNWDEQRPQGGPKTEPGDALIKKKDLSNFVVPAQIKTNF